MSSNPSNFDITDFNYMTSTIGNAYFSGVCFAVMWEAVETSQNREQFDQNVSAAISGKEALDKVIKKHYG